jgi:hypothetical protein
MSEHREHPKNPARHAAVRALGRAGWRPAAIAFVLGISRLHACRLAYLRPRPSKSPRHLLATYRALVAAGWTQIQIRRHLKLSRKRAAKLAAAPVHERRVIGEDTPRLRRWLGRQPRTAPAVAPAQPIATSPDAVGADVPTCATGAASADQGGV